MYGQAGWGFAQTPKTEEEALSKLYKDVPEYRKRLRKAKALRGRREKLQAMEDAEVPLGAVSQGTNGGLFQTQGRYIANSSGLMQKAIGALGGAYEDRKGGPLEEAEGELDTLQSEKLLEDALILGRRARARRKPGRYSSGRDEPDTYGGY